MKPQNIALIVLIAAALYLGLSWFAQPVASPVKIAGVPVGSKPIAIPETKSPPLPQPSPAIPSPPHDSATIATGPVQQNDTPSTPNAESVLELKAVFADMARLYRASDLATLAQTYTPPARLKPETIQSLRDMQPRLQADETSQLNFEASAQSYEALAAQTPTFNAAGDEATYIFTQAPLLKPGGQIMGTAKQKQITFVKINGRWYRNE